MMTPRTDAQRLAGRKYFRRKDQETLKAEIAFAESGKWKVEGCWCGAGPARIEHRVVYTELTFGRLYLTREYRCADCRRDYKTQREVK
jgi:hypothetical protein